MMPNVFIVLIAANATRAGFRPYSVKSRPASLRHSLSLSSVVRLSHLHCRGEESTQQQPAVVGPLSPSSIR